MALDTHDYIALGSGAVGLLIIRWGGYAFIGFLGEKFGIRPKGDRTQSDVASRVELALEKTERNIIAAKLELTRQLMESVQDGRTETAEVRSDIKRVDNSLRALTAAHGRVETEIEKMKELESHRADSVEQNIARIVVATQVRLEEHAGRLNDHAVRIKALETQPKSHHATA